MRYVGFWYITQWKKTRVRGWQEKAPIQYKIAYDTNIKRIPLTRFLSHENTKAELTDYLAKAILKYKNQRLALWRQHHEEADTLMICLAAEASQPAVSWCTTSVLHSWYRCLGSRCGTLWQALHKDINLDGIRCLGSRCGTLWQALHKDINLDGISMVDIEPIWRALGKEKAQALPIFHTFTGADNIGKFSGIGKTKWF